MVQMNDWFTSDLHFLHKLVAEKRGFCSASADYDGTSLHDETIIRNWNRKVKVTDRVWVLGDLSLSKPEEFWPLIDRLHGELHLITGNHDPVFPGHRRAYQHQDEFRKHFASVQPFTRMRMEGRDILLSHFPYNGDSESRSRPEGGDRYPQYRLRDEGLVIVHGHTHRAGQVSWSGKGTLQLHVGLDAHNLEPVPSGWLQRKIREHDALAELAGHQGTCSSSFMSTGEHRP